MLRETYLFEFKKSGGYFFNWRIKQRRAVQKIVKVAEKYEKVISTVKAICKVYDNCSLSSDLAKKISDENRRKPKKSEFQCFYIYIKWVSTKEV